MAFILGAGVILSSLFLKEIRFSGQTGSSILALYAADSGGEKALYESRKNNNTGNFSGTLENSGVFNVSINNVGGSVTINSFGEFADNKRAIQITFQK